VELKINFDGRTLILSVLAAACLYGLYSGVTLASAAHDLQRETKLMKEKLEQVRSGKTDLTPAEMLEIASVGMQEQMNPGFLESVEAAASENATRGYLILAGSVVADLPPSAVPNIG